jgi:hypothetical protein
MKGLDRIKKNILFFATGIVLVLVFLTNCRHSRYNHPEGVIEWDVKSYYAWLPAIFIYNDLSLEFRREDPGKFGELIWPVETPTGKQAIVTTMGMALLYSPFFFTAHLVALVTSYEADGYSRPYRMALTFSALFYLFAGMHFLSRVLLTYFTKKITAFTLIAVTLGTNLFYYSSYEAPMSHASNFALIAAFLWITIRFYKAPSIKLVVFGGILAGLITLIRPTNIIVLVIFFLWDIVSFKAFHERFFFFLKRWTWVLFMALAFVLVWLPQFLYWYWISGQIFYFSYGELGGRFFFNNPQIFNILFSIKKGWFVYTPIMFLALSGILVLFRRERGLVPAISLFLILNIYILSSWWNWWYGGGFGLRSFIDSYAIMAVPLAALLEYLNSQRKYIRFATLSVITLLIMFNLFQTRQYVNNAIHWWWMNREAYRETFLKLHPTEKYWSLITIPDHDLARQGVYVEIIPEREEKPASEWRRSPSEEDLVLWIMKSLHEDEAITSQSAIHDPDGQYDLRMKAFHLIDERGREYYEKKWAISLIINEILESPEMTDYIRQKAGKNNIPFDSMLLIDAEWIFNNQR